MECEAGLPFSSDELQLVRDEVVVSMVLSNGKKENVLVSSASVSSAYVPSSFISSHLRTVAKIEEAIDTVTAQVADRYVVPSIVTASG
jgi:hypothetical protein